MKFLFLLPIFIAHVAHATPELNFPLREIPADQIFAIGKPIENRETGEQLALTCTSQQTDIHQCKKISFVYIKYGQAFLIGPEIQVEESDLDHTAKEMLRDTRKRIRQDNKHKFKLGAGGSVLVFAASGIIFKVVLATSIAAVPAIGAVVGIIGLTVILFKDGWNLSGTVAGLRSIKTNSINATREHDSWNWSTNTKKISAKKFNAFYRSIAHLYQYD